MRTAIILTAALLLAACGVTGKDISVAEYSGHMVKPFDTLPTGWKYGGAEVIVIGKSSEAERALVANSVAALNAALPDCAQLRMIEPNEDFSLKRHVEPNGQFPASVRTAPETLFVEFVTRHEHYHETEIGTSWGRYVQLVRDKADKFAAVHELTHSMGIYGHVPFGVNSLMTAGYGVRYNNPGYLSKSDRAVLAHLYPCG